MAKLLVEARGHERRLEALVVQRTAEVHAREADLHRAQLVARVGSWVFDFSSKEFHGSTEALRIFGMSGSGRFDLNAFAKCVHPDDRKAVEQAWQVLVKAADAAMYAAKQVGNSFRFCGAEAGKANSAEA
jgi:hypothetical protein